MAAELANAIALAAAGEFAAAEEICSHVAAHERAGSHVLRASMWRQLGDPARAHMWDQRGHEEADDDVTRCDARIGLIADAIACGDMDASSQGLHALGEPIDDMRVRIRWHWVRAEHALACGDGVAAVSATDQAVRMSTAYNSARHLLKSNLIAAVAAHDAASTIDCAHRAADRQWRYLAWAASRYLATVDGPRWGEWADVLAGSIAGRLTAEQGAVWRANPAVNPRE